MTAPFTITEKVGDSQLEDCTPAGQYANICDLNNKFGSNNILLWSDLNNTKSLDTNRITVALNYADSEIVTYFTNYGNYTIPLSPYGYSVAIVTEWAAVIAGCWLYFSRGMRDTDTWGDHLNKLKEQVMDQMMDFRSHNRLHAATRWPQPTAPTGYSAVGYK